MLYTLLSGVIVGLEQLSYNVSETASSLIVCASLSGQTERNVFITLVTVQGTAQGKHTS